MVILSYIWYSCDIFDFVHLFPSKYAESGFNVSISVAQFTLGEIKFNFNP